MNLDSNIELFRHDFHDQPVVLVEGFSRSGKSMLGPILVGFKGVENQKLETAVEKIPFLYRAGKISEDAAVILLKTEVERMVYENMISRNMNFRLNDYSSVFKNVNGLRYIKRLFLKEGSDVLKRISQEKPIFQTQTHEHMCFIDIHFKAFGKQLRVLEMVRHPVDVVYDNYTRGYGTREIEGNQRIWGCTIKHKDKMLPWHAAGWEEEYANASPIDRVIMSIAHKTRWSNKGRENLSAEQKTQVLTIPFEKFVVTPQPYLQKITQFIGREANKHLAKALKNQRVPRVLQGSDQATKRKKIEDMASPECMKLLNQLSEEYEEIIKDL